MTVPPGQRPLSGTVVLIIPFRVPEEERERFLANHKATMERLRVQDGFPGGGLHELLQPVHAEAFDYANSNHWRSAEASRAGIAVGSPDGVFGDQVERLEAHPGPFSASPRLTGPGRSRPPPTRRPTGSPSWMWRPASRRRSTAANSTSTWPSGAKR